MTESHNSYSRIVRLQAISLDESKPTRVALDEQVRHAVTSLANLEPTLRVSCTVDGGGNPTFQASASGYDITIATRSGQDTLFQGGNRSLFISYSLCANSSVRCLNRAASFTQHTTVILRGAGALTGAFLFFWVIDLLFSGSGPGIIHIPLPIVIAIVLAGAWLGGWLGKLLGTILEAGVCARAEKSGALDQLDCLWAELEQRFNVLLRPYDPV
jgi:hypothetical protein